MTEKNYSCVTDQLQYLILAAALSDRDYAREGFTLGDLCSRLAYNHENWKRVGSLKEKKSFPKRLDWALSNLADAGALQGKGNRRFVIGPRFDEVMRERLTTLADKLKVELDYSHLEEPYQRRLEEHPEWMLPALAGGFVTVELLSAMYDKPVHLFTTDQVLELAMHIVMYGAA
jgi:hypothetical protein